MRKIFFSFATVATEDPMVHEAVVDFENHFFYVGPPETIIKYEPCASALCVELAILMNCEPSEVTFAKNTSDGIIIASEALPLAEGDEVLILENEFRADLVPWLKKRKDGVVVRVIEGANYAKAFEDLIDAISERTKVIAISWIQYADGYMTDIDRLSLLCKELGIFLVLDAVQGIGARKLDLERTPVSILACGGQKYLRAGPGTGFLYVNRNIMGQLKDTRIGTRGVVKADKNGYVLKNGAERFQDGTMNLEGVVALHAAVRHINSLGMEAIEKRNLELLHAFKACLRDNNISFVDHGDRQGNIITLAVEDPQGLVKFLEAKEIYIKYLRDKNVARLSFHHTSTLEDFRELVKSIREWIDSVPQAKNTDKTVLAA